MNVNLPRAGAALLVLGVVWAASFAWLGYPFLAVVSGLLASFGLLVIAAFDETDPDEVAA